MDAMNWLRKLDRLVLNLLNLMIALRVAGQFAGRGNEQDGEDREGETRSTRHNAFVHAELEILIFLYFDTSCVPNAS